MIDDLLQEAKREQRRELEAQARAAVELRARLPEIVRETVATILEEADDLEHARELAGLEGTERTPSGDLESLADDVFHIHTQAQEELDVLVWKAQDPARADETREHARTIRKDFEQAIDLLEEIERRGPYTLDELESGPDLEATEDSRNPDGGER